MDSRYQLIEVKPYCDVRGKLFKIAALKKMKIEDNIEEIYMLYTNKGAVRGNHYHKQTVEYFSVISGKATVVLRDMISGHSETIIISEDQNIVIKVPENVAHAFKNDNEEQLIIVAVSSKEYDEKDNDTYSYELII